MLDVHAPEHGIHGVRDFLIHLLTITVGLLIALGLENAAEAMHHRHQRKEAEATIRQEIRDNRDSIRQAGPTIVAEYKNMHGLLAYVQARSQGKDANMQGLTLLFSEGALEDSAWRTASSTGALSYMDYDTVQSFASVYKEQDLLQTTDEAALADYFQIGTIIGDPKAMTPLTQNDAIAVLPFVRSALAHLAGLVNIGKGTLATYDAALNP